MSFEKYFRNVTEILKIARKEAEKSDVVRAKLSALLIDEKGHVVCRAFNYKRDLDKSQGKFTVHAEEALIAKWRQSFKGYTLFVYRRMAKGFGMARPCPKCQELLKKADVKEIYYTTYEGFEKFVFEN